jgi:hypothetical protein
MPDVVDVLLREHEEIRHQCLEVQRDSALSFDALERLITRHEHGERIVVHPAARNCGPDGDAIGRARLVEEGAIERALTSLGLGQPGFDERFARLHQSVLDHLAHEERDEFPLLRLFVPTQRLHMMAGQMHDIQVMGVG